MLVLNRLLLNREYVVINALKALGSVISMCGLHVIFLSNITPRYFTLFTNRIFRPFSVRRDSVFYMTEHYEFVSVKSTRINIMYRVTSSMKHSRI
jgi:hypothetical protein